MALSLSAFLTTSISRVPSLLLLSRKAALQQRSRFVAQHVRSSPPSPSPSRSVPPPPPLSRAERESFDARTRSLFKEEDVAMGVGVVCAVVVHCRVALIRVVEVHNLNRVLVTTSASGDRNALPSSRLLLNDNAVLLVLGNPWSSSDPSHHYDLNPNQHPPNDDDASVAAKLRELEERGRSLARALTPALRSSLEASFASPDGLRWFTAEQAALLLFPREMSSADPSERVVARYAALHHLLWRWDAYTALQHAVFASRPKAQAQLWRSARRALNDEPRVSRFLSKVRRALLAGPRSAHWATVLRAERQDEAEAKAEAASPSPSSPVELDLTSESESRELLFALTHVALGRDGGSLFAHEVAQRLLRPLGLRHANANSASQLLRDLGVLERDTLPELADRLVADAWGPVLEHASPSDLASAQTFATRLVSSAPTRLVHELAYAIDSADTTEVDDAVSLSRDAQGLEWIHVHIADPAALLEPDSSLARVAQRRATTVYLPHARYAMLPSATHAPLGLDETLPHSRALTFSVRLDPSGALADARVALTRVRVARITFDQVEALLDLGEDGNNVKESKEPQPLTLVQRMLEIARTRRAYRTGEGAVTLQLPQSLKVQVELSAAGARVALVRKSTPRASLLVEEAMIVAAEAAARIARDAALPIAFRAQSAPVVPMAMSLEEGQHLSSGTLPEHISIVQALRLFSQMPSATLESNASRHHSLALGAYARATSPLRRYADLVTHWQLRALLAQGKARDAPFSAPELDALLPHVHYTSKRATTLQRHAERHWKLRWVAHTHALTGGAHLRAVVYALTPAVTLREALAKDATAEALGVDLDTGAEVAVRVRHIRYYIPELELQGAIIAPLERSRDLDLGQVIALRARLGHDEEHVRFELAPLE